MTIWTKREWSLLACISRLTRNWSVSWEIWAIRHTCKCSWANCSPESLVFSSIKKWRPVSSPHQRRTSTLLTQLALHRRQRCGWSRLKLGWNKLYTSLFRRHWATSRKLKHKMMVQSLRNGSANGQDKLWSWFPILSTIRTWKVTSCSIGKERMMRSLESRWTWSRFSGRSWPRSTVALNWSREDWMKMRGWVFRTFC